MRFRTSIAALLLLFVPLASRAEDVPPEQILPATTQIYIRWDGYPAHADAYHKTALGKMLSGDTGVFITKVYAQLQEAAGIALTAEQLLNGIPPEKLQQLQADGKEATQLPMMLGQHGFIIAGELRGLTTPQGSLTLIVPNAGAKPDALFGGIRLALALGKIPYKELTIEGRKVGHVQFQAVHAFWWVEGKHAVVTIGDVEPEKFVAAVASGKHARLTSNPLFKKVSTFKGFETDLRGFFDVASLAQLSARELPAARKLISDLGIDSIKGATFYSGFENDAVRTLTEVDVPGPRVGLLALLKGKTFRLADVPSMPPDVSTWSMTQMDLAALWDLSLPTIETVVGLVDKDSVPKVQDGIKKMNEAVGIDLRKDLLGSLGDKMVTYNSFGDGPLFLGTTLMFKVKDGDKLQNALSQLVKSLAAKAGGQVALKKRTYRGVELREVYYKQQGFPFVPTYAIHDGWLVISLYPQAVQGFIQRSKGEMAAWKPSPRTQQSFDQMPKDVLSMTYSDPVPTVRFIMAFAPLLGGFYKSFQPESSFEVGSIPNTQEVTRHLFPNVSVFTDDGKTLRYESRVSMNSPLDASGGGIYQVISLPLAFSGLFK